MYYTAYCIADSAPFNQQSHDEARAVRRRGDGRESAIDMSSSSTSSSAAMGSAVSTVATGLQLSKQPPRTESTARAAMAGGGPPICLLLANVSFALGYAGSRLSAEARCSGGAQ